MYNKHTMALYAAVISSIVIASVFGIGFVQQQAVAQGNQTGSASSNMTGGNMTGGGNMTSGGTSGNSSSTSGGGSSK